MDKPIYNNPLLELLDQPAFFVRDGVICQVNRAAQQKLLTVGEPIANILGASLSPYQMFDEGCLFLTVSLNGNPCDATVSIVDGMHLFCLEDAHEAEQALALAAQQLRAPIHSLFSVIEDHPESDMLRRSLYQLQRAITNMADFPRYREQQDTRFALMDLCSVFGEIADKAASVVEQAGGQLHYTALPQCVIGLADREMLERAVFNLISNAVKFSPAGSTIEAKLTQNNNSLCFTVQDQGAGIDPEVLPTVFSRYLRTPGIEDGRYGIGLGMALVRTAAACHGGTVLITCPAEGGTKITMTIAATEADETVLRSPVTIPFYDYSGGRDHGLLELSDVLPATAFQNI